jgi:outer membrane protein OmpA-like peptidoglycan-associated protein
VLERAGEQTRASHTPDARLADALKPAVTTALRNTVRDEPQMWADALFPVLLPAVRLAVASALRGMVRTLNQVLEESLSPRSWTWRIEALRSHKTFAEVVLLRTLVYRVEHLLLIDRQAGLLLVSATADEVAARDPQLISAMLTALQDFAADSFELKPDEAIREVQVGDLMLLLEVGPRATLAAAVRGNSPAELRETLRAAIDLIHQEFLAELLNFRDDTRPFEPCRTILEGCLQSHYHRPESKSYTRVWIFAAVIVFALAAWIGFRTVESRRWDRAVGELRNTPGIVVTRSDRHSVEGLRDPFARAPESVLEKSGIDIRKVSLHFRPFISLEPEIALARARLALDVPNSVATTLQGNVMRLSGDAPHAWILQARSSASKLALLGIRRLDLDAVADREMDALREEIDSSGAWFNLGSSQFTPEQQNQARAVAAKVRRWMDLAVERGKPATISVSGYTDSSGEDNWNRALSLQRADHFRELLLAAGVPREAIRVEGLGKAFAAPAEVPARLRRIRLQLGVDGGGR